MHKRKKKTGTLPFCLGALAELGMIICCLLIAASMVADGKMDGDGVYRIAPLLCLPGTIFGAILANRSGKRKLALSVNLLLSAMGWGILSLGGMSSKGILTLCVLLLPPLMCFFFPASRKNYKK